MTATKNLLLTSLLPTVEQFTKEFDQIPTQRKEILNELVQFVENKIKGGKKVYLNFICTHNSRRSHFGQIWAKVAGDYYNLPNVNTYSGGTSC